MTPIHIQWSDDGQHIRKWARDPFAGSTEYAAISTPIADDAVVTISGKTLHDYLDRAHIRQRIGELMEEDEAGFWRACSGCQESVDGCVSATDYPYNETFRCQPGSGCRECGGIGVIWDDTDYSQVAKHMARDDVPVTMEPDWLNADTCIQNMRIAYDDATEDEDETPVDTVVSAGDLGVLIGLAEYAVRHRLAALASAPAGDGVEAATRMMRDCADDLVSTASHHGQYAAIDQDKIDGLRDAVRDFDAALASAPAGDGVHQSAAKYAAICAKLADQTPVAGEPDPLWWERQSALREAGVLLAALARPRAAVGEREA